MSGTDSWRESLTATVPSSVQHREHSEELVELVHQLGIDSIRAALLDPASLDAQTSWSMNPRKEAASGAGEAAGPESAFLAARDASLSLRDAPADYTMVRKLSPRLWSFAWMAGADQLVIVETRYLGRRDALDDKDSAVVRLVFRCLSQGSERDLGEDLAGAAGVSWTGVDRRRRQDWGSRLRAQAVPLLLLALSALMACWMFLVALPTAAQDQAARQAEIMRLQTMSDKTVIEHLLGALVAGDYGLLQDELTGFHALGYFPRAVVLNARERVVATVGMGAEAPIGAPVPAALASSAQSVPLARGGNELGRLLYDARSAAPGDRVSLTTLRVLAALGALAALAAGVYLLLPGTKRRR